KWWYTFVPTIPSWDFPLVDIADLCDDCLLTEGCVTPSYAPIFGDGPFTTIDPAVPAPGEFPASMGGVMLARAPWTDAFGNMIIDVSFDGPCIDICPSGCEACEGPDPEVMVQTHVVPHYQVVENVTYDVVLEADGWDMTPLGPVTDLGRYWFEASLEHGFLGDIKGHESEFVEVCCDPTGPCECETCEDDIYDSCLIPHYFDAETTLFAISPDDARMASEWAWSWIEAMYELDLTAGTGPFTYGPSESVNRAQMALFMSKLLKDYAGVEYDGASVPFGDVPVDHWAADAISNVVGLGISTGCGGGNFCPLDPVTRGQMAIFLERTFRLMGQYGYSTWWDTNLQILAPGDTFVDVPQDAFYNIWVEELYADGLTSGCKVIFPGGEKYYCPMDPVTRGQMARFIVGAMLVPDDVQGFWPVLSPEME
ncbi:MAG: S-layer homology domain-containing protein, partial [Anaerolineales bacterium]